MAAAALLYACSVTAEVKGGAIVEEPFTGSSFGGSIEIDINGHRSAKLTGLNDYTDVCLELEWLDADGNVISTTAAEVEQDGTATSEPVPVGAKKLKVTTVACPGGMPAPGFGSIGASRAGRPVLVMGFPVPNDSFMAGETGHNYAMFVWAENEEVDSLVDPILEHGWGAPVPGVVDVLTWMESTATTQGLHTLCSMPGQFSSWSLDANGHAYSLADAQVRRRGSWTAVSVLVPWSEIHDGQQVDLEFRNDFRWEYEATSLPGPSSLEVFLEHTY